MECKATFTTTELATTALDNLKREAERAFIADHGGGSAAHSLSVAPASEPNDLDAQLDALLDDPAPDIPPGKGWDAVNGRYYDIGGPDDPACQSDDDDYGPEGLGESQA